MKRMFEKFELILLRFWIYITLDYSQKLQMHKAVASQHTLFHMVVHVVRLSNSCLEGFLKSFLHFFCNAFQIIFLIFSYVFAYNRYPTFLHFDWIGL